MAKQHRIRAALGQVVLRCYTFIVMAVVVWAGYTAVTYLYRSVFLPAKAPATLLDWQADTRKEALRSAEAPGITEPARRSPLAHYHMVDRWFQPDPRNGCIASGCHDPVPHTKEKSLRAFANLHATFLTCETCHAAPAGETPIPAVWLNVHTGRKEGPPPILQLMSLLDAMARPATSQPDANLAANSENVIRLLHEAANAVGSEPVLEYLAKQIETSEPGSPVWRMAITNLTVELPGHARGEYGAKIALVDASGQPVRRNLDPLIEKYFSRGNDQAARSNVVQQIHQGVDPTPQECVSCHRGTRLDFVALGYPSERIRAVTSTPIVGMMQQIREGQPFNLPLAP